MIKFSEEERGLRTYSPTGVPLINLCIQNENSSPQWHLKPLLKILLKEGHYDFFDPRYGNLLTFALKDYCFESIRINMEDNYNNNIESISQNKPSFVGYMFKKLRDNIDQADDDY